MFSSSGNQDWAKAASGELSGQDPFKRLTKNIQGLSIKPYYDSSDQEVLLISQSAPSSGKASRFWLNLPPLNCKNDQDTNQRALHHLSRGAEGIHFIVEPGNNISALLKGIVWPFCFLSFVGTKPVVDLSEELVAIQEQMNWEPGLLSGSIFLSEIPHHLEEVVTRFKAWDKFCPAGIIIPPGDPVTEIVFALSNGTKVLDRLTDEKMTPEEIQGKVAFSFSVGTDFFIEAVKLRAFRSLWLRIVSAYGVASPVEPHIHAQSTPWKNIQYDPHENMIKGTTAALSSVLGGATAISIWPEDDAQPMTSRIAGNVSLLLKEEARIDKVTDPFSGSYFIESLTAEMTGKAWSRFISNNGGL